MRPNLYVSLPLDPASLKAAEDRDDREQRADSSIVSVTRESADERRRREFWEAVDMQQRHHHARQSGTRTLTLVRNA